MFTIHLTRKKYALAVQAAQMMEGNTDTIHVSYESPPNVQVGDEVEVHVEGQLPQVAVVDKIKPPVRPEQYGARQEAIDSARDQAWMERFAHEYGVPLDVLKKADAKSDHWETLKNHYWLILRHKGPAPAPRNAGQK